MSTNAIEVEGLGKRYRIGRRATGATRGERLRHAIAAAGRRLARRGDPAPTIWALRDVSFASAQGEVIGVVGDNGAGKSTLLKILTRITEPTTGRARVRGRVGSLLEVGTGFHPELTGRENVFLNGAVLGMRKAEIRSKFDEIVAFSGVEEFLDTPVKRYSSGMAVRLAFAVAAHLEPEILLIDEVLAVGDAAFQKKCLGKMSDVAREGRTILFVSHRMSAVQSLCSRVIWLENGQVRLDGGATDVISRYLRQVDEAVVERSWEDPDEAPGNEQVRLRRAAVTTVGEEPVITTRTPVDVVFELWNRKDGARLNLGAILRGKEGGVAFYTVPLGEPEWHGKPFPAGLYRSGFRIPGDLLNDGRYTVQVWVVEDQSHILYRHDDILVFDVADDGSARTDWHGDWVGAVRPLLEWRTERLDET